MAALREIRRSRETRIALAALSAVAAAGLGVALLALVPDATRLPPAGRVAPVAIVVVGWSFVALGLFAAWRRPDAPVGAIMAGFGLVALVSGFSISESPWPYLLAVPADALALASFVHLLLAFPSGRLEERAARRVVAAGYAVAAVGSLAAVLLGDPAGDPGCADCPANPVLVTNADGLAEAALAVKNGLAIALTLGAVVLVVRRARRASAHRRRAYAPLAAAGAALLALVAVSFATQALDLAEGVQDAAQTAFILAFAALPAAFLAGLVRSRFFRGATMAGVIDRLARERDAGGVRDALATALHDPSLEVAFWVPDRRAYVDRAGHPIPLPADRDGAVLTEIRHQGRRIGALIHDPGLAEDPALMRAAAGAAGLALENDRLEVELRARLQALRAASARIVAAGDAERRRLGRDLHDGAQQRLVALMIELRLARGRFDAEPEQARALIDSAFENAEAAVGELRELAAGIHPAILSQRGLDAALESLATRAPVPVELAVEPGDPFPPEVDTALYFVVAESLTNVAKYASATHAQVRVGRDDGAAVAEIGDDGVGGADPARGSGLRGLADRVGALEGTIEVESPPGGGTRLRARIPLPAA